MKRVLVFVLALMLCAGALAENEYFGSPKMYMEENGLLVFSGDQLSEFGVEMNGSINYPDLSFSSLQIVDGAAGIIWYQNRTQELFFAIDMTYLLSGGRRANIPSIAKTYIDFCRTFSLDLYRFRNNDISVCCIPNLNLNTLSLSVSLKEDTKATIVKTIDDMANRLKESMY